MNTSFIAKSTPTKTPASHKNKKDKRSMGIVYQFSLRLIVALSLTVPILLHAGERMNVLLIAVDDLRNTLGCYGDEAVKTPNIDRLASRGVVFERAYVQYPVCNASRSSFLTGLRPDQTGITNNKIRLREKLPNAVTFPQWLKEKGWHSAAHGKIFHLGGGRDAELQDKWMDLPKSWHTAKAYKATEIGSHKLSGRDLSKGRLKWCHWGAMDGNDQDQPDGQIASTVIREMEQLGDQPWMIGCGFMKPHDPFVAPRKYFDLYPEGSLSLYRDPEDQTSAPSQAVGFGAFGEVFSGFTDMERMEFLRAYYACTSFMDAQVGRVLNALDRLNLRDRTLIIFLGDHGYHLGERNWWNKNTLFDRSCRSPLVIAGPNIKPGRARGLVEFIDLFPTIVEHCGVETPGALPGQSLWPQLRNPSATGRDSVWTMVSRGPDLRGDSIRTDRWRFTQWSDGAIELYDHTKDQEENFNQANTQQSVIEKLSAMLNQHRKAMNK